MGKKVLHIVPSYTKSRHWDGLDVVGIFTVHTEAKSAAKAATRNGDSSLSDDCSVIAGAVEVELTPELVASLKKMLEI